MKYVINDCFGGFGLSEKALRRLHELGCTQVAMAASKYYGVDSGRCKDLAAAIASDKALKCFKTVFTDNDTVVLHNGFRDSDRNNPLLVQVVEELGEEANGMCAKLKIVEVPDSVEVEITEYDGLEECREASRYFG